MYGSSSSISRSIGVVGVVVVLAVVLVVVRMVCHGSTSRRRILSWTRLPHHLCSWSVGMLGDVRYANVRTPMCMRTYGRCSRSASSGSSSSNRRVMHAAATIRLVCSRSYLRASVTDDCSDCKPASQIWNGSRSSSSSSSRCHGTW